MDTIFLTKKRENINKPIQLIIKFANYIEVLKPRETLLLTYIGICTAVVASGGNFQFNIFAITILAILCGSAGSNGLTNYLDREIDSKMNRTKKRVLPSGLINPPQKILPLVVVLITVGLFLAWILNPICFFIGLIGVISSSLWRKTVSCTILGIIASCCPVLIGWFALKNSFDFLLVLICLLIVFWIPIHVWSVMVAKRDEYESAGLRYFPLSLNNKTIAVLLLVFSLLLYVVSLFICMIAEFNLFYLVVVNIAGSVMVGTIGYFIFKINSNIAWRIYKLSAFPYLGIIFAVMCLNVLIK